MIKREEVFSLEYYKKAVFTGGDLKMRYRISKEEEDFLVIIWRGPLSFDNTDQEKFEKKFPYSEEGLKMVCDYINAVEEEKKEYFDSADAL